MAFALKFRAVSKIQPDKPSLTPTQLTPHRSNARCHLWVQFELTTKHLFWKDAENRNRVKAAYYPLVFLHHTRFHPFKSSRSHFNNYNPLLLFINKTQSPLHKNNYSCNHSSITWGFAEQHFKLLNHQVRTWLLHVYMYYWSNLVWHPERRTNDLYESRKGSKNTC